MTTTATTTRPVSLASRRRVLQGIGAVGLVSMAGCLAPSTTAPSPETATVAPGSAFVGTMSFPVPGDVKLVDHALSRVARKGALAVIHVEGEENPEIFDPDPEFDSENASLEE